MVLTSHPPASTSQLTALSSGAVQTGASRAATGALGTEPGPLQEQYTLLTSEVSIQPHLSSPFVAGVVEKVSGFFIASGVWGSG
ncbi:hypothetical protein ACQP3D_26945, partial [Escherichia coli]